MFQTLEAALVALRAASSTLPSEDGLLRSLNAERSARSHAEARREVAERAEEAESVAAGSAAAAESPTFSRRPPGTDWWVTTPRSIV
ncbi:MAG: hypothetical protein IPH38_17920 [Candidatus Microthrix sp.]|nr:hypothetical protein [Candidatus Microthrix sp.]MBK7021410.1 hypothetical protein [Candidatus Microthrix sp.]